MEITKYTHLDKGNLVGQANAKLQIQMFLGGRWETGFLTINEIKIFKNKEGGKFISFPSRPYEVNGEKKYFSFNYLDDKRLLKQFEDAILRAIPDQNSATTQNKQEDLPF